MSVFDDIHKSTMTHACDAADEGASVSDFCKCM